MVEKGAIGNYLNRQVETGTVPGRAEHLVILGLQTVGSPSAF